MGSLRLKGQDTRINFTDPDGPVASLVKLIEFEIVTLGEILEEHYCDEDAPDFDDISNGISLKAKYHHNDPAVFDFFQKVNDRRSRIAAATGKFSSMARCKFPNGITRRILVPDISWGDLPFTVGGRKAFTSTEINGKASKIKFL